MSNDHLVQSIVAAGPRNEADYEAVFASVNATERGRWFLAEFARRNRTVDTDLVLAAVARIEAYIRGEAAPAPARENKEGERTPTTLRGRLAALAPGASFLAPNQPPGDTGRVPSEGDADRVSAAPGMVPAEPQKQSQKDVADALQPESKPKPQAAQSEHAGPDLTPAAAARDSVIQDNSPRWYIEPPDFVFSGGGQRSDVEIESAAASVARETQLSGARLLTESRDDAAETFDRPQGVVVALDFTSTTSADAAAAPSSPPATALDPVPDPLRPQLRVANLDAPTHHRPIRGGPLSVADALSEDEVIALFG